MRERREIRLAMSPVLVGGLALLVISCGQSLSGPPLEIEFRDSLVQLGQIVRLTNTSNRPLTGMEIKVTNPNGDVKHHSVTSLAPGDSVEVGWRKLDGFQVQPGAKVSVRCEGYLLPFMAKLAAAGSDRSGELGRQTD